MDFKDYYKTLGVARNASAEDIKKAYRKLVRKHHPDVSKAADADRMTKDINEAYGVLGDAEKRAAYDALGSGREQGQPFTPPPGWGDTFKADIGDSGDFFADLFAHLGRRNRSGFTMRGQNVHATLDIDLRDAYHGAHRQVSLRLPPQEAHGPGAMQERNLQVTIPKGVQAGQQLRLAGQGHPGQGGGPPGDLFLEIRFRADPRFTVDGRQVQARVPVAPWEAALGALIEVPTPSGAVEVNVPAGSQSGRKLRLKGRGIPGNPPGDLYLVLDVVLPPASSDKARALYQSMARELAFNPRGQMGA